jgi:2-polyprenyl-3-methyl-5-hydroxy-6-metoxy-1,4-benzoquinol methylase
MLWRPAKHRFVQPPEVVRNEGAYRDDYATYTAYNYRHKNPVVSRIKSKHFDIALAMTASQFGRASVVDFGCGDGPFLPSLSRHFTHVVGVDANPLYIEVASNVIETARLANARAICNDGKSLAEVAEEIGGRRDIVFVLEMLEHTGVAERMYESKAEFLDALTVFLKPEGVFVVSVPKMVGFGFLVQRMGLAALRLHREPLTWRQLFDLSIRRDATDLERVWTPSVHLGFDQIKLGRSLLRNFEIVKEWDDLFQVVWMLRRKARS